LRLFFCERGKSRGFFSTKKSPATINPSSREHEILTNQTKFSRLKSLRQLNKYFWKYKYRLLAGVAFVAINNYFGAEAKLYVGKGTDYVADRMKQGEAFSSAINQKLLFYAFLVIGLVILQGVFMFLMRPRIIVMSRLIEYDSKNEIFTHYQSLDQSFYKRNNTGDLMNRISEDVSRVRMYTGPAMMYIANTLGSFFFTIPYMFHINMRLTLIVLSPMPVIVLSIWYVSSLINRRSTDVQRQLSAISTFTQETFSGIRVMKAYAREEKINAQFGEQTQKYRTLYLRLVKTEGAFQPLVLLLVGLSNILAIYFGGMAYIRGEIKPGEIITLLMFINGLIWPIASLGWVTSLVQRAAASQERINEFLHTSPEIMGGPLKAASLNGQIEFKNVSLTYPDSGIKALKNVSFQVSAGHSLAIVGRTGSGKSTIAALISRLYDATEGHVNIDGHPIRDYSLQSLRGNIGYVPQEVFLFSDTIANNILFVKEGDQAKDKEEMIAAAQAAAIHDGILEFPNGYETLLGERGITLSGGQKQRISMARALVKSPSILIFDDCLSAVDTETEEEILQNLGTLMKNKTTLIISHRISSVKNCDHILVLEDGVVAEQGTHDTLLKQNGLYSGMYTQQLLENELKA
jgi:ATP-binding cassette subfamily B multidrug efflux pump